MSDLLRSWLDPQQAFNQLSLVWLGPWSGWLIALVICMIGMTLWLGWRNVQRLSSRKRSTLLILRCVALFVFFVLFACDIFALIRNALFRI